MRSRRKGGVDHGDPCNPDLSFVIVNARADGLWQVEVCVACSVGHHAVGRLPHRLDGGAGGGKIIVAHRLVDVAQATTLLAPCGVPFALVVEGVVQTVAQAVSYRPRHPFDHFAHVRIIPLPR